MKGTIPDARWAHTGVVCGYNIIIFAGYAGGSYVNDVWKLDTGKTNINFYYYNRSG